MALLTVVAFVAVDMIESRLPDMVETVELFDETEFRQLLCGLRLVVC